MIRNYYVLGSVAALLVVGVLGGCVENKQSATPVNPVVVVDLARVAEETGNSAQIKDDLTAFQDDMRDKLAAMESSIQDKLKEHQETIGKKPSQEQVQEFQQLVAEAQRRLQQAGNEAQQVMAARQKELMNEFISEVRPVAREIAKTRGARMVMARGNHIIDYDAALDITDDVVKKLLQNKPVTGGETESMGDNTASAP